MSHHRRRPLEVCRKDLDQLVLGDAARAPCTASASSSRRRRCGASAHSRSAKCRCFRYRGFRRAHAAWAVRAGCGGEMFGIQNKANWRWPPTRTYAIRVSLAAPYLRRLRQGRGSVVSGWPPSSNHMSSCPQRRRYVEVERVRGAGIDEQLKGGRLVKRYVSNWLPVENADHEVGGRRILFH